MKNMLLPCLLFLAVLAKGQTDILPVGLADEEVFITDQLYVPGQAATGPPPYPVRHMAEWEELQALCITWRSFPEILTQIAVNASFEVKVIIFCPSQNALAQAQSMCQAAGANMANIELVVAPSDSVWIRDYGPNCVYANDVDELNFIDWVYNRPRPKDDTLSIAAAAHFNVPLFGTTAAPERMVNTGGNFMSDGLGRAFASKLILEENAPGNDFNAGPHSEEAIDSIMQAYMGIQEYVKMETLPYDAIHHIDMHMRLLDEETLLVGKYPDGISDGPQIEANIEYVLSNFTSPFGTPYKIERVVQPPDFGGVYPPNGDYRTYTNAVFVNKTILIPTYQQQFDTTALRVYRELHPGYKVVGINCNDMIWASGALHCITKEIGSSDPLWIVHQRLKDVEDNQAQGDYPLSATIRHKSGIDHANVYFTIDTTAGYQSAPMVLTDPQTNTWSGAIPHQPDSSVVYYYVEGTSVSGKTQVRPLAAPTGYYHFRVNSMFSHANEALKTAQLLEIFPNPAAGVTVVPVNSTQAVSAEILVMDNFGRQVAKLHDGLIPAGESKYFFHAERHVPGFYFVVLKSEHGVTVKKLTVK